MAPEVVKRDYNNLCDMWSAGVILYVLLSGYPPFYGDNDKEILDAVMDGHYDFDDEVWEEVSDEAKDLIKSLLCPIDKRFSGKDALNHPWLNKF